MARCRTIAILGNGGAAVECAKALRSRGFSGTIRMFSDNGLSPYNPTLTTYYVAGKITYNQLFPFGDSGRFYKDHEVEAFLNAPVTALDVKNRTITAAGSELPYDQCLIATGASPILPAIPGIRSPRVFTMRTVGDAEALRSAIAGRPKRAVVVGASMIGIKLVELFSNAGIEVCLADLADHVFPLAAHPDCASVLERRLENRGIRLRLGAAIAAIEEGGCGIKAYFNDSPLAEEADLLVMCIGVWPNLQFVDRREIAVDKGILVDAFMRTNVEGVYAAGDVAQGKSVLSGNQQVIGLWANARCQGQTAGLHMAGNPVPYRGEIPHNITHFMGMTFAGIGDVNSADREMKIVDGDRYAQLFWKEGRLTGVNLIDWDMSAGVIRHTIIKECIGNRDGVTDALALLEPWKQLKRSYYFLGQRNSSMSRQ